MNAETAKATAEAEVRELVENWLKAVRAKDINGVMSHYAADILLFDLAPPLRLPVNRRGAVGLAELEPALTELAA